MKKRIEVVLIFLFLTFFSLGTEWTQVARKRTTTEENTRVSLILQNMHWICAICDMHRKQHFIIKIKKRQKGDI